MFDRGKFFAIANRTLFHGTMTDSQTAGINMVLDEAERLNMLDNPVGRKMTAYMLATDFHETNATMQPVIEAYWLTEDWRRRNLRYYPYYGRGLPQLTWERNYRRMTELLRNKFKHIPDFDLVKHPEQALIPEVAVAVMFEGMMRGDSNFGDYTGKALEDYFTHDKTEWVKARYIVNGTDKAAEIAEYARKFYAAIEGQDKAPIRMLTYGTKGNDVEELQRALENRGYDVGEIDGDFGDRTRLAVIDFQRANGLAADGIVGDATRSKLA